MEDILEQSQWEGGEMLSRLEFYIPKWVEMLPQEHPIKENLVEQTRRMMDGSVTRDKLEQEELNRLEGLDYISKVSMEKPKEEGTAQIHVDVEESFYYQMLSSMAGVEISGEYQLISMIRELSSLKQEYEKARQALESVRRRGYGVITPNQEEIHLEEPVVTRQGSKYGVKLKASSPSIHLIKAEIDTEISPIVGDQKQAEDLIAYIKDSSQTGEGIWETNIFGKSIQQLTEDGIRAKLSQIGEESQEKLQKVMQRIVNETSGGFICIIL